MFGPTVSFWSQLLNVVIVGLGLLMILTILIQRGKGGGLIGAFGGAGGSSPFGSKAGDTFTRITITMAGIWVLLIMIHVKVAKMDLARNSALSRRPPPARANPGGGPVLLSMTGFGEARWEGGGLALSVEVRTVNNRYLKVSVRGSEPYPMLEPELEKLVRKVVRRGTVTIHVRCDRVGRGADFVLNAVALRSYLEQVRTVCDQVGWQVPVASLLGQVLALPGVAPEPGGVSGRPPEDELAAVERTLEGALGRLQAMRQQEGRAMADELLAHRQTIADHLGRIRDQVPAVVEAYRHRLRDRVGQALAEHNVTLRPEDLIREVAVFAERSDVAEEVTRLASHLEQFEMIVRTEDDGPGRKLEFLVQEMGRETNTIGSKAGDVGVSRQVVEIKAALEKVRELVQNVE